MAAETVAIEIEHCVVSAPSWYAAQQQQIVYPGRMGATAEVHFDDGEWPLVIARVIGPETEQSLQEFFSALEGLLGRGERFYLLFDTRGAGPPRPSGLMSRVRFIERNQPSLRVNVGAAAVVVESAAFHFLISGILSVKKPPFPLRVHTNLADARAELRLAIHVDSRASLAPPGEPAP